MKGAATGVATHRRHGFDWWMPVAVRPVVEAVENLPGTEVRASYAGHYSKLVTVSITGSLPRSLVKKLHRAGFGTRKAGAWTRPPQKVDPWTLADEFLRYVMAAPPSEAIEATYRTVDGWLAAFKFAVANELLRRFLTEPSVPLELGLTVLKATVAARSHLSAYAAYYRHLEKELPRHPSASPSELNGLEPWVPTKP
jgi:hypothetical protein